MRVVIIVPCFNESGRMPYRRFAEYLAGHPETSFCFVDDGSSDDTGTLLKQFADGPNSCVLTLTDNCGKAEAVRQGLLFAFEKYTDAGVFGFWDADLAAPLEEIGNLISYWREDVLMLLGCRHLRLGTDIRRRIFRHYIGRVFATAVSVHLNLPVYDTQCGAKLIRKELIPELFSRRFVTRWFFDVEILRRCIAVYGLEGVKSRVVEVPLKKWSDIGESKVDFFRCMWDFCRLLCSKN